MRIFLDTANIDELKRAAAVGVIDGVTTNPSLIAAEGNPIEEQIRRICDVIDGDVSAEVVETEARRMIEQGRSLARVHRNVIVKVPVTRDGITACAALTKEGIRTNMTLCFSAAQALLTAKAGAYLVSPFLGRLDDIGTPGIEMIRSIVTIFRNFGYKTQVLAASVRGPMHLLQCAEAGVDVCTIPSKTFDALFHHPLTDKGLDQFLTDYHSVFQAEAVGAR